MNLTVKNSVGEQFNIIVVRYFKFNGINYLIFTKNEIDEAGYQKLYISKINNMIGNNIDDEIEWNLVRDTIKVIAKANKDNTTLPVQDLNEAEVNGIQIVGQKPFKLTVSSVALLGANKKVLPAVSMDSQINTATVQTPIPTVEQTTEVFNNVPPVQPGMLQNDVPSMPFSEPFDNVAPLNNVSPVEPMSSVQPTTVVPTSVETTTSSIVNPNVGGNSQMVDNTVLPLASDSNPMNSSVSNDLFGFSTPTQTSAPVDTVDYKKLYEEQTLKLNALTVELNKYKSLIEQLKNILN